MNKQPASIDKNLELPRSMNYARLKEEGIDLVQKYSGDIWTDYNEHDPGVTILEQLCYALTELGFKANFPVEDLLCPRPDEVHDPPPPLLFPPEEIFPPNPTTPNDYRKLIIDHIPQVRNAWVEVVDRSQQGVHVAGLYRVLLQLQTTGEGEYIDKGDTIEAVRDLLASHRNLCEDIDSIEILNPQPVEITGEIQIHPDEVGESVLANVLFALSESLTPQVRLQELRDLLITGQSLAEIYSGPAPKHGFIDDHDLERSELNRLQMIQKSHLVQQLSGVSGVRNISNFKMGLQSSDGGVVEITDSEFLEISEGSFPVLSYKALNPLSNDDAPLKIYIGDVPYDLDFEVVRHAYEMILAEHEQRFSDPVYLPPVKINSKRIISDIRHYFSIQNDFPENYGIGPLGIPKNLRGRNVKEQKAREAYAKQLKAYLMFFEQLMTDFLAQITHLRELLTLEAGSGRTYFSQSLHSAIPRIEDIIGRNGQSLENDLMELAQKFDRYTDRRNRFLDHILAILGEEFLTEAFNELNRQAAQYDDESYRLLLIAAKRKFLNHFPQISRSRGQGFNYRRGIEEGQEFSGLKRKISLMFNLIQEEPRRLSQIADDKRLSGKKKVAGGFQFTSQEDDTLNAVLRFGIIKENYHIRPSDEKANGFGIFFRRSDESEEVEIFTAGSQGECIQAFNKLMDFLRELNEEGEGFYLLEHILLRPTATDKFSFFLESGGRKLLESPYRYGDEKKDKKGFFKQLIEFGKDEKNHKILKYGRGDKEAFKVGIYNLEGKIHATSDEYLDENSAINASREIIDFLKKNQKTIEEKVKSQANIHQGALLTDDPYSLQLSVVLPAWPARMQNEKLKRILMHVFQVNAPAHLEIHFHWIDPFKMKEFEDVYYKWIETKASPSPKQPLLDRQAYYLMMLIKSFQEPDNKEVQDELKSLRGQKKGSGKGSGKGTKE